MPRVAEPEPSSRRFPWDDWQKQLLKAPTGTLLFDQSDFGDMTPRRFREEARKAFRGLNAQVSVRGEEVLVSIA